MAIIKKLIAKRRKRLEEEAAEQSDFEFRDKTNLPEKDKPIFARGYEIAYVKGKNSTLGSILFYFAVASIFQVVHEIGMNQNINKRMTDQSNYYQAREARIIGFYEKYGSCPNDANSVYLENRKQKWKEEVETKK